MRAADDGFGLTLGGETIGIYSQTSARGFSPQQAGNVRVEGLYFDLIGNLPQRFLAGTTMHVGLSAQSYPFPAPTGVADNHLRVPPAKWLLTVTGDFEAPYGFKAPAVAMEVAGPVTETLGFAGGTGYSRAAPAGAGHTNVNAVGGMFNWRPTDDVRLIAFYTINRRDDVEVLPLIFTAGPFAPPVIDRQQFIGQDWAASKIWESSGGALARFRSLGAWQIEAGLFRTTQDYRNDDYSIRYFNTQRDGSATLNVLAQPGPSIVSWSGEARATGNFTTGGMKHVLFLAARGKSVERLNGGSAAQVFGAANIGVARPLPEPVFALGPQTRDRVRQGSVGVAYVARLATVEASVGVQKAEYRRRIARPGQPEQRSRDAPWLYNSTIAWRAARTLVLFGSYTRGLEDSGVASDDALNRGEVMPASLTEQVDVGLRYQFTPRVTLIADAFQIEKPYFSLNPQTRVFGRTGDTRHRGVEASLTARPVQGLSIIGGAVIFRPRRLQSGPTTAGRIAPGRPARNLRLNVQYGPPSWRGFSLSGGLETSGPFYYDQANTLKLPGSTRLDVGARYDFKVKTSTVSIRAQATNVADTFRWQAAGDTQRLFANPARQYALRLVADF